MSEETRIHTPSDDQNTSAEQKAADKNEQGLKPEQKAMLQGGIVGAIAAGVVSLGANYRWGMTQEGEAVEPEGLEDNNNEDTSNSAEEAVETVIHERAPMADSVSDDMSFGEAFAAARQELGAGGFFVYEGELYNTYYKEEWEGMSEEEQQEYWASIDYDPEYYQDQEEPTTEAPEETDTASQQDTNEGIATTVGNETENFNLETVGIDENQDGIPEGQLVNRDDDPYVEQVGIDQDQNGVPEATLLDTDHDNDLDTAQIDTDQDGKVDEEHSLPDEHTVIMPYEDAPNRPEQRDEEDTITYEDDNPDFDDDADMSSYS